MNVAVKICGLREPRHAEVAARAKARWVGVVLFPPSPRFVSLERVRGIVAVLPDTTTAVGVLVDPDDDLVRGAVEAGVGALQLHGNETPDRTAEIRLLAGVPVIRALGIGGRDDLRRAQAYRNVADMLLFDARPPSGSVLPGGNARAFDWTLLAGEAVPLPWILSGGLDAGNVKDAIGQSRANAVDVSSGIETAPGVKSEYRILAFLDAASRPQPGVQ